MNVASLEIGSNSGAVPIAVRLADEYAALEPKVQELADQATDLPRTVETDEQVAQVGAVGRAAAKLLKEINEARMEEKRPHLDANTAIDGFFKPLTDRLDRIARTLQERASDYQRRKIAEQRRQLEEQARKAREEEERQRQIAARAAEANRQVTAAKAEDRAELAQQKVREAETAAQASAADLSRVRTATGVVTSKTEWSFRITDYDAIPLDKLRPYLARTEVEKALRSFIKIHKASAGLPGVEFFEDVKASFRG